MRISLVDVHMAGEYVVEFEYMCMRVLLSEQVCGCVFKLWTPAMFFWGSGTEECGRVSPNSRESRIFPYTCTQM